MDLDSYGFDVWMRLGLSKCFRRVWEDCCVINQGWDQCCFQVILDRFCGGGVEFWVWRLLKRESGDVDGDGVMILEVFNGEDYEIFKVCQS